MEDDVTPPGLYLREKNEGGPSMDIVTREEWGASAPQWRSNQKLPRPVLIPMRHITFTHTNTETCHGQGECCGIIRRIQREQMDCSQLCDITFNFLIGGDGTVYEGRGWYTEPHRPMLYEFLENKGIEVGYIGEFEDIRPPPAMLRAAFDLILYGMKINLINVSHQCIHLA